MKGFTLRDEIQEYIKNADERFLKLVYGMVQADKSDTLLLNDEEIEELDKRVERHKTGDTKSYTWAEVKKTL